jgi:endonuclease V-like protein UPF0215 family
MFPPRSEENSHARYVGVDDGRFIFRQSREKTHETAILAAVVLENHRIMALRLGRITVDGIDATTTLERLLRGLRFDAIFLSGISFAGFNLIDPFRIYQLYKKPVIIISGSCPDNRSVRKALRLHFKDWRTRWATIKRLGRIHQIRSSDTEPPIFFEFVGESLHNVRRLVRHSAKLGRIPEPIRVAGLVAKGLSRG